MRRAYRTVLVQHHHQSCAQDYRTLCEKTIPLPVSRSLYSSQRWKCQILEPWPDEDVREDKPEPRGAASATDQQAWAHLDRRHTTLPRKQHETQRQSRRRLVNG